MQTNPLTPQIFMFAMFAVIFYFILWRPQQQQRKKHEETIRTLKRGDDVVTSGGVVGEVVHIQEQTAGTAGMDDRITIKSGDSRLIVERRSVGRVGAASQRAATTATKA